MIGHGASANVHKILDPKTNKKYAGKFIGKEYLKKTPKRVISVTSEIATLRKLDHPGIVKLIEVHEIEDYVILVLEHLEGEPLHPDLFKYSKNRENEVRDIFLQITSSLKYMNDYGLMHRDIKPNNLRFLEKYDKDRPEDNVIKLIDFGFAEYYTGDKYTRYYCGTVGYMCPFLMNMNKNYPQNYGPEVDYFSIGVVLYYALTGQKVFNGKNHEEKRKLNKLNKVPVDKINDSAISLEAKDLILKLLVGDPRIRLKMNDILDHPYFVSDFVLVARGQSNY